MLSVTPGSMASRCGELHASAKAAAVRAGRYARTRQFRRMRRELKRLRTSREQGV
ncbi:hypothetical protein ILFOPFJJ_06896 [Ensifer psoraleae]|nr:hypothetical protein [Sinorhizobium psoraleae]